MNIETYIGNELEVFEHAQNWKNYYGSLIKPYLKGDVLEVGAGIGGTTIALCNGQQNSWTCLEPDPQLAESLYQKISAGKIPDYCQVKVGTLRDIPSDKLFNAIIYIDVIEHIENDSQELVHAARHLHKNGSLIVLVPAHQWLFSPFDAAIGHYRRYNKKMLKEAGPINLKLEKLLYLDSVGLAASTTNKLFLKQSMPNKRQILFWDKTIVPVSKVVDFLSGYKFGKSLLGIWHKF